MKDMELTLNGNTFATLKRDFDRMLICTLKSMERRRVDEATLTVKLKIELEGSTTRDYQANGYDAKRDIIKPKFAHEITTAMQIKEKTGGDMAGEYELVFDEDARRYKLRPLKPQQGSLLDRAPETDDDTDPEDGEDESV